MKPKRVIILGTGNSWKNAPLGEKSWEIWGMNSPWKWWGEYATRWFEIHEMKILKQDWDHYKWIEECPIPIYMDKHYSNVPKSIPYPIDKVNRMGYLKQFSSTFAYEMALAIHEGFKEIGLYGIEMSGGSFRERFIELPSLMYWIGIAMGCGIKVHLEDKGEYIHKYLYGIEYWKEVADVQMKILRALHICMVKDGVGPLTILEYYLKINPFELDTKKLLKVLK